MDEGEVEAPPPEGGDAGDTQGATTNCEDMEKLDMILDNANFISYSEPYMDALSRMFPPDRCTSRTEMPWEDIVIPKNVKIRETRKKKCPPKCPKGLDCTGMFIPATPEFDNKGKSIEVEICFGQEPDRTVRVRGGGGSGPPLSSVSTISGMCVLHINVDRSEINLAYRDNDDGPLIKVPLESEAKPTEQLTDQPSTAISTKSSGAATLKSIGSQSIGQAGLSSAVSCGDPRCQAKVAQSMPSVSSKKSIKAAVSFKDFSDPSKSISKEVELVPGSEFKMNVPGENVVLSVKASGEFRQPIAGDTSCQAPCAKCSARKSESRQGSVARAESSFAKAESSFAGAESSFAKAESVPTEQISGPPCPPEDKSCVQPPCQVTRRSGTTTSEPVLKHDMVMQALDAYEAEMKPLKQALAQLQEKIRNLNITDIQGAPSLQSPYPQAPAASQVCSQPGPYSMYAQPAQPAPMMSIGPPAIRPASYAAPAVPAYMRDIQQGGYYGPPAPSCYQAPSYPPVYQSPPPSMLAVQARQFGMIPDYRGRNYGANEMPYQPYQDYSMPKRRWPESPITSDRYLDDIASPGADTDDEYRCPFMEMVRTMSKKNVEKYKSKKSDRKHSSPRKCKECSVGKDDYNDELFKSGIGIKTDPKHFSISKVSTGSGSSQIITKTSSNVLIKVKRKHK